MPPTKFRCAHLKRWEPTKLSRAKAQSSQRKVRTLDFASFAPWRENFVLEIAARVPNKIDLVAFTEKSANRH